MSAEKIKFIYEKNKSTRGPDIVTPIFFILLVSSIFGYLYTEVQKRLINIDMTDQRCNPRYLFFSGFLNPLDKNPWHTTQSNFQKCVASNTYKDVKLARDIKKNENLIKKGLKGIEKDFEKGRETIGEIKDRWTAELDSKQMDINRIEADKSNIFNEQEFLYQQVAKKSMQLFNVIKSILIYMQGILAFRVNTHKEKLNFNKSHDYFMNQYNTIQNNYNQCYDLLDQGSWKRAINTAKSTIKQYEELTEEIDQFISKNFYIVSSITESCYQLKHNIDNDMCDTIFPNINKNLVDFYPELKTIFKDVK